MPSDINQRLADAMDQILNGDGPRRIGFVLLTFPFDKPGAKAASLVNYVSNAQRADMLVALKEIVARFEGQAAQSGRA